LTQKEIKEIYDNYGYIIDDLRDGYYIESVKNLFNKAKTPFPVIDDEFFDEYECAKAFWIALIHDKFEYSIDAKIVFNAIGLYDETKNLGRVARRIQFILLSEYKGTKTDVEIVSTSNKNLSQDTIDRMEDNLSKVEKTNLCELIDYSLKISLKQDYYFRAWEKYTRVVPGKPYRCVDSSRFSLSSINSKQIFFIKAFENKEFLGREEELKTIEENFRNHNSTQIIYGMGGVGKTQIALQYAYLHKNDYDAIIWLGASNFDEIINNCKLFIKEYGKNNESIKSRTKLLNIFRDSISNYTRCLIIFDNVDYIDKTTQEAIKALNIITSIITENSADVLITTRCDRDYRGITRIRIDTFTPDIADAFLERKTRIQCNESSLTLARKMGFLPLALDYAGAYIAVQQITYDEYLELWEKFGSKLFDNKGYSETTIRIAFHLTIDKLKDLPLVMDFLQRIACLKASYLPLETYLKVVKRYPDAYFDGRVFDPSDGECFYPDGAAKEDYLHKALDNELERNELIHILTQYSLITMENGNIYMHPLLAEIIFDEISPYDINKWYGWSKTMKLLAMIYEEYGDKESSRATLYSKVLHDLDYIRNDIIEIPKTAEIFRKRKGDPRVKMSGMENILRCLYDTYEEILVLNDSELEKEAMELRREIIPMLISISDVDPCMEAVREIEADFLKVHPEKEVILQ